MHGAGMRKHREAPHQVAEEAERGHALGHLHHQRGGGQVQGDPHRGGYPDSGRGLPQQAGHPQRPGVRLWSVHLLRDQQRRELQLQAELPEGVAQELRVQAGLISSLALRVHLHPGSGHLPRHHCRPHLHPLLNYHWDVGSYFSDDHFERLYVCRCPFSYCH